MSNNIIKIMSLAGIIILVANFVLFILKIINWMVFWFVIIVFAVMAWLIKRKPTN